MSLIKVEWWALDLKQKIKVHIRKVALSVNSEQAEELKKVWFLTTWLLRQIASLAKMIHTFNLGLLRERSKRILNGSLHLVGTIGQLKCPSLSSFKAISLLRNCMDSKSSKPTLLSTPRLTTSMWMNLSIKIWWCLSLRPCMVIPLTASQMIVRAISKWNALMSEKTTLKILRSNFLLVNLMNLENMLIFISN